MCVKYIKLCKNKVKANNFRNCVMYLTYDNLIIIKRILNATKTFEIGFFQGPK